MENIQLPSNTHIGDVTLKIKNLKRSLEFYNQIIGFKILDRSDDYARLSASGEYPSLLNLHEINNAISRPATSTGLYHYAIRLPTDEALANLFQNLLDHDWPIQGAADHIVSKAIYFSDPDGNGIEIYSDRPRENWEWNDGEVSMATDRLDVNALLHQASITPHTQEIMHPESTIGHVHLSVSNLTNAEWFYHKLVGMDITQRSYPGALFFSAGGYHHHIGVNTWAGVNIPAPPPNAAGLEAFSLIIPDKETWAKIINRLKEGNIQKAAQRIDTHHVGVIVHDPSGNGLELRTQLGGTNPNVLDLDNLYDEW